MDRSLSLHPLRQDQRETVLACNGACCSYGREFWVARDTNRSLGSECHGIVHASADTCSDSLPSRTRPSEAERRQSNVTIIRKSTPTGRRRGKNWEQPQHPETAGPDLHRTAHSTRPSVLGGERISICNGLRGSVGDSVVDTRWTSLIGA